MEPVTVISEIFQPFTLIISEAPELMLSNFISLCRSRDLLQSDTTFTAAKPMATELGAQISSFWSFLQLPSYLFQSFSHFFSYRQHVDS
jgi:hypothetical protein